MNTTREAKHKEAVSVLDSFGIYKPYIKAFDKDETVCFFENYAGYWARQEPQLLEKIKEFEQEHDALVYAVTHELFEFGDCYSFLFVSDYEDEWGREYIGTQPDERYVDAYVWNATDDTFSEFGTIGIKCFGGGIKRIA